MQGFGRFQLRGAALLAVVSLAGCGNGISDDVAVRVGGTAITRSTVAHWMSVMAAGRLTDTGTRRYRALKRQALAFLISSEWLTGEAAKRGESVTHQEVLRRLDYKEKTSFPGGKAEFQDFLKTTGQTVADLELAIEAALTSSKLRHAITMTAPRVTRTDVISYYENHRQRFAVPELREVMIANRKSARAANELKDQIASGTSFATLSPEVEVYRIPPNIISGRSRPLEKAIHSAKPHVIVGPVKQSVDYFVFELKRVTPASYQSLGRVERAIARQLTDERQRRARTAFSAAWTMTWTAKTDCHSGYVVPRCRQYSGPKKLEAPFS